MLFQYFTYTQYLSVLSVYELDRIIIGMERENSYQKNEEISG
jgi:hypothetical protein